MQSVRLYAFLAFLFFIHSSNSQVSPVASSSLELTGTNFVSFPDNNLLDLNTNTTFEGWYNFCSSGILFSKNYCNYEAGYYLIVEPSGAVRLGSRDESTCNSGSVINSTTTGIYAFNQWHHFALTISVSSGNTQFQLFMDHNPAPAISQTVSWVTYNNTEPFRIGTYRGITGTTSLFPKGRIQDFRVYSSVIPFSQQCMATPAVSPFLRLQMQSGSTNVVTNTGTLSTALTGSNLNSNFNAANANYLPSTPNLGDANLSYTVSTCGNQIALSTNPFAFNYTWLVQTPGNSAWNTISNTITPAENYTASSGIGTYTFIVSGAIGSCINSDTVSIPVNNQLNVSTLTQNESCLNACNGSITTTVSGGTIPYTYSWSNSAVTPNISNLCAGSYSVQVTDQNGCIGNAQGIINTGTGLSVSTSRVNETCLNACNGSITTTVSGGTIPYTYSWSNSAVTPGISNLCAGNYSVQVTDQNGCIGNAQATINPGAVLSVTTNPVNETCLNACNGSITSTVSGGAAPYSYSWSNAAVTPAISNLCPGNYSVQVTDQNGCIGSAQGTINPGAVVSVTATAVNETCQNDCNGSITTVVSGGVTPYTYSWSNAAVTSAISNLCPGNYSVQVNDQNGCTATSSATVIAGMTVPDPTIITSGPFSAADAPIQFAANSSGGTWSSNCGACISASGVFNPQTAGEGTFQICYTTGSGVCTDQDCQTIIVNGCTQTTSESQIICPGSSYTFNGQNFTDAGAYSFVFTGQNGCDSTHTLDLSVFTVNATSQILTPCEGDSILIEGTWYLESDNVVTPILDGNGCLTTHTTEILFKDCSVEDYAVFIPNTFTPDNDNINDFFSISIMGGFLVEGFIVNRWGNIIKEFYDQDLKWDGRTTEGKMVQDGVYTYVFIVSSNQGQKTRYHGFVTVLR